MASGIYTASRVKHAQKWLDARNHGAPIISTWIDEAGEGETPRMHDLWSRCITEAIQADVLILYRENGEPMKGALVEAGAALGAGKLVIAIGFDAIDDMKAFSFLHHPMVVRRESIAAALALAFAFTLPFKDVVR